MEKLRPTARKAIQQLKELFQLAVADLEKALGAPLPIAMQRSVQNWLSRAWEAGRDSRPSPESARRIAAYLDKLERRDRAITNDRRRAITVELEQMWAGLTEQERELVQKYSP